MRNYTEIGQRKRVHARWKRPSGSRASATEARAFIAARNNVKESFASSIPPADAERLGATLTLHATTHAALDILADRFDIDGLRHFAEAASHLTGARYSAIVIAPCSGNTVPRRFICCGMSEQEQIAVETSPGLNALLEILLRSRKPLRLAKIQDHPTFAGCPPGNPRMQSFLGVPVIQGSVTLGCILLADKLSGPEFVEEDECIIKSLGVHTALAVHLLNVLEKQRQLARGLMEAHEDERRAVAYDLHDGLTQYVMTAYAHLQAFQVRHQCSDAREAEDLNKCADFLNEAVLESRRLVNGLRALTLEAAGLPGALEQLLLDGRSKYGWQTAELTHNIGERRFDTTVETALFRVAQEALTNAGKHASSPGVQLTLLVEYGKHAVGARLTLSIRDWGRGFNKQSSRTERSKIGLHSMSERIRLIGGEYELHTAPDAGVHITASIPISL